MLRTSFAAAALLGALALAAPAAAAPAEQAALDAAAFNDAAGDSGAAPDITNVAVGNDVVAGPIVFWLRALTGWTTSSGTRSSSCWSTPTGTPPPAIRTASNT